MPEASIAEKAPQYSVAAGLRLLTKRRAYHKLRKHALRAVVRTSALVATDTAMVLLGVWIAQRVASVLAAWLPYDPVSPGQELRFLAGILLGLLLLGAYGSGDRWRAWTEVFKGVGLGVGLFLWDPLWVFPGRTLVVGLLATATLGCLLSVSRAAASGLVGRWRKPAERREGVLLVAPAGEVEAHKGSLVFRAGAPFHVKHTVPVAATPDLGRLTEETLAAVRDAGVGTVVVAGILPLDAWSRLVELADVGGWRLLSLARNSGSHLTSVRQFSYSGVPVTEVTTPHLRWDQLLLKRGMDVLGSGILLVVLAPLLLFLAVAIRLTSPGPVFFTQERVGMGGRPFRIIKFRSMVLGAEARLDALQDESLYADRRLFKMRADPRVTRIGAFMRRTSLDELPQLFNVLRGDMSLVGPRPPIPSEVLLYEVHHYCRFEAKPGITGPWQVAGRNEITDFEEVVLLEREYVRNWHLVMDIRILLETIPAVLSGRGAA